MVKRLFEKKSEPDVKDWEYEAASARRSAAFAFILSIAGVAPVAVGIEALSRGDFIPGSPATFIGGMWTVFWVSAGFIERNEYKYYLGELAIENDKVDQSPQTNQNQ